jgi:hypothetical protein
MYFYIIIFTLKGVYMRVTDNNTVKSAISEAEKLLQGPVNKDSKKEALQVKATLQGHIYNLNGATRSCCRTTHKSNEIAWATEKLKETTQKVAALDKKFGIGPNWLARGAGLAAGAAVLAGYFFEALPSVSSLANLGSATNMTTGLNVTGNATAAFNLTGSSLAAGATSGLSLTTLGLGLGVLLTVAYLSKKCLG